MLKANAAFLIHDYVGCIDLGLFASAMLYDLDFPSFFMTISSPSELLYP